MQMRLTSVSAAPWLYVDDEAAHRMSEPSIAKAGMAENSIKMVIKKRLDTKNGPNWALSAIDFAFSDKCLGDFLLVQ